MSDAEVVRQQVAEGLRAEVKSSSPIAGQKSIELDFHPERKARFSGLQLPYPEVPTAPTGMELLNEKIDETLKKISEMPIDELADRFGLSLPENRSYQTVAGLIIDVLQHLPVTGEVAQTQGWQFEIVDMDGRRIDKLLASRL